MRTLNPAASADVHEWSGSFEGRPARIKCTSVVGHVFSIDFPKEFNDWTRTDPTQLFAAKTVRNEANPKAHVVKHLSTEARGCEYLVLWLDCDREGENICFEARVAGCSEGCIACLQRLAPLASAVGSCTHAAGDGLLLACYVQALPRPPSLPCQVLRDQRSGDPRGFRQAGRAESLRGAGGRCAARAGPQGRGVFHALPGEQR